MNTTTFIENLEAKTITVERTYEAALSKVWSAWTRQELLEKWWAPLPWKAVTKSFEFRVGGQWHYYMLGPEGEKHWCVVNYTAIAPEQAFEARDQFCDEEGNLNADLPANDWRNEFRREGNGTRVHITLTFVSADDLKQTVEMGFKEGFTMGLNQLEELLSS